MYNLLLIRVGGRKVTEELVYEGRLLTIMRVGKLLRVEPPMGALIYSYDELLSETQMILAALLGDKA